MNEGNIRSVLQLLGRLRDARIYYSLADPTEGAIMVKVSVPGERWEIEFHEDGEVGIEVFVSKGIIQGPELLEDLFHRFSD